MTSTLKIDYIYEWRECSRCKPYVDEMFDDDVWGDYDSGDGIDQQTFWDFMVAKHYDIWCEWQHADEKERAAKAAKATMNNQEKETKYDSTFNSTSENPCVGSLAH